MTELTEQALLAVIKAEPKQVKNYYDLCDLYRREQRYQEITAILQQSFKFSANARAYVNLGVNHQQLGEYEQALHAFTRATVLEPELATAHYYLGMTQLFFGDFDAGWQAYWYRHQIPGHGLHNINILQHYWQGERLADNKLYVVAEQGLGDTIQFVRFLPLLKQQYNIEHLTLVCADKLHSLLANADGVDAITNQTNYLENSGQLFPLLDLPLLLKINLANLPNTTPYLTVAEDQVSNDLISALSSFTQAKPQSRVFAFLKQKMHRSKTGKPLVGLVWRGRATHANDNQRSMKLHTFKPLFNQKVNFISLQKDVTEAEQQLLAEYNIFNSDSYLTDFCHTAYVLQQLDYLITVDTSVLHLAGALNVNTKALIPNARVDWRWHHGLNPSPWYPSVELILQGMGESWDTTLQNSMEQQLNFNA